MRRLRSKIEIGGSTYIETVRNVGYKFLAPPPRSFRNRNAPLLSMLTPARSWA